MAAVASGRKAPAGSGGFTYYICKGGNDTDCIARAFSARTGWTQADPEDAKRDGCWTVNFVWKATWSNPKPAPPLFARGHANLAKRQLYNHWKAVEPLCAKDTLFSTLTAFYNAIGEDPFKHIPLTFLIEPRTGRDHSSWPGWGAFERSFHSFAGKPGCQNLWLIKPTDLNRGIGIEVVRSLEEVSSFLATKARGASMGIQPVWVLQKYIENPLLFAGRKFDLRVWAMITDSGDIYLHAPGYIRTSSETFSLESTDRYTHLTNWCQQKVRVIPVNRCACCNSPCSSMCCFHPLPPMAWLPLWLDVL